MTIPQGAAGSERRRFRDKAESLLSPTFRVVHFLLDPRVGGPHVYVRTLVTALGGQVGATLVTAGRGPITDIALINLRHRARILYGLEIIINMMLIVVLVARARVPRRNTIFAVHGAANLAPILAARLLSVPVVWYLHESWTALRWLAHIGKRALAGSRHRVVAVADEVAEVFDIDNYLVMRPPIDLNDWKRDFPRRADATHAKPLEILVVANFNPLKGHDILLDALLEYSSPFRLRLIGAELQNRRDYYRALRERAEMICRGRSDATVEFLGWLEPEGIRRYMSDCDVFVLPSRSEASPIVLLEAMAMECVCIATHVGGVDEILADPSLGFLVNQNDPKQLCSVLVAVAEMRPTDRIDMGARARQRVRHLCDLRHAATKHRALYEDLLRAPQEPTS